MDQPRVIRISVLFAVGIGANLAAYAQPHTASENYVARVDCGLLMERYRAAYNRSNGIYEEYSPRARSMLSRQALELGRVRVQLQDTMDVSKRRVLAVNLRGLEREVELLKTFLNHRDREESLFARAVLQKAKEVAGELAIPLETSDTEPCGLVPPGAPSRDHVEDITLLVLGRIHSTHLWPRPFIIRWDAVPRDRRN